MRQFDESKPLEVHCDASHFAVGCQLVQRDENGHEYAVENRSKKFNQHEINMSISEKEMAAIVYALKEFRGFLLGRSFKIITDHSALTYLMSLKDPTGKLYRWNYLISQFEGAQIIHRKGNMHCNADYLSRPVLLGSKVIDLEESKLDPWENSALMYYLKF